MRIIEYGELPSAMEREPCEGSVLYLADKQIQGTARVTLAARFSESLKKSVTKEAKDAHERRYLQAVRVGKMIYTSIYGEKRGNPDKKS